MNAAYKSFAESVLNGVRATRDYDHSVARRRAQLVVQCATELLRASGEVIDVGNGAGTGTFNGADTEAGPPALHLDLTVAEFEAIFRQRYGSSFPSLTNRSESSLERARLERRDDWALPKVLLRRGAPPGRGLRRDKL